MKQKTTRIQRHNYLSHAFDQLADTDQTYMDTLTTQLAEIQAASPEETRLSTGKKPKSIVEQNKEQK